MMQSTAVENMEKTIWMPNRTSPLHPTHPPALSDVTSALLRHNKCRQQGQSKWMGMGSGRYSLRSTHSKLLLVLLALLLSVQLASARHHKKHKACDLFRCVDRFNRVDRRLKIPKHESPEHPGPVSLQRCRVLRRYVRCLANMEKRCRGDLQFHGMQGYSKRKFQEDCYNMDKAIESTAAAATTSPARRTSTPARNLSTVAPPPTPGRVPAKNSDVIEGSACTYRGRSDLVHCSMFGDPHLRTFGDRFYTCKVNGTWPLINNDYMVVMATSVPVREGFSATVITKITVLIKGAGKCAGRQFYSASSKNLPKAFTDGSTETGSVSIEEVHAGKHVEISAGFIGTTVVIRRVGTSLTFAINTPREFVAGVESQHQLCDQGCPEAQAMSPAILLKSMNKSVDGRPALKPENPLKKDSPPGIRKFTEAEARGKCKEIILAVTGVPIPRERAPGSSAHSGSFGDDANKIQASSSLAFSSLVPSSNNQRKTRTASRPTLPRSARRGGGGKRRKRKRRTRSRRQTVVSDKPCAKNAQRDAAPSPGSFNFYFDSCVFDLVTTGDVNFTLAARAALEDVRRMHALRGDAPGVSLEVVKLWEPVEPDAASGCGRNPIGADPGPSGAAAARLSGPTGPLLALCVVLGLALANLHSLLLLRTSTLSLSSPAFRRTLAIPRTQVAAPS